MPQNVVCLAGMTVGALTTVKLARLLDTPDLRAVLLMWVVTVHTGHQSTQITIAVELPLRVTIGLQAAIGKKPPEMSVEVIGEIKLSAIAHCLPAPSREPFASSPSFCSVNQEC